MFLTTLGIKMKITESINAIINSKFKFLDKYLKKDTEVRITCLKENSSTIKISVMFLYKGKLIKSSVVHTDFYTALDELVDKTKKQLIKNKEKKSKHSKNKSLKELENEEYFNQNEEEYEENEQDKELEFSNQEKRIVKRKIFAMKEMSEEEAILQMEVLNHNSFMFLNSKTGIMCLLYKRKDGNFGLIESQI